MSGRVSGSGRVVGYNIRIYISDYLFCFLFVIKCM